MVWLWTVVIVLYLGGGALGLLALRSILTGAWGNTGFSKTWEGLIKHHRFTVTTTLITLGARLRIDRRSCRVRENRPRRRSAPTAAIQTRVAFPIAPC